MQALLNDRRLLLPVLLTAIAIAVGSVLIVVLSDDASGAGSSATPAAAAQTASGAVTVDIADFKFEPETLTVKAGTKVTWRNQDAAPHTATAKDGFDTGTLRKGERKTLALKTAGTFAYVCEIHPFMTATVRVT
jgi:plastocyanin